jgi:predicted nuclease of predicted toxin-antitoxin system
VKLLFDENLPPRLIQFVVDVFPGSIHVHDCGLGNSDDGAVWEYAKSNGFAIVSRDSDFQDRSVIFGDPPKVIWLRVANCSTDTVARLLINALPVILRFIEHDSETLLILSNRPN